MWEQIRSNRRRSILLVIVMAAVLFLLGYVLAEALQPGAGPVGLTIAFVVWVIMAIVSYYRGGNIMLAMSGAREIQKQDLPVLYNVVEEMMIASGMPKMPRIFIIDDPAPNAFATGRDPEHAAVAVTSGLLNILNRDELQGVVAHELGHVQNRDILFMLMTGVMVGAIILLADMGVRMVFFSGGRRSRSSSGGGQAQIIMMVVAIVLAILAPIIAYLIYFAISRKREYLADASSAQYTRYPEGLASALEKLAASTQDLSKISKATAPMYIVNPLKPRGRKLRDATSTHPPISDRIKVLRSMGGGASFVDYDQAFRKINRSGRSIIPASTIQSASEIKLRAAAAAPGAETGPAEKVRRKRSVQEAVWKANKYDIISCDCGANLKVPPTFKAKKIKCPRCGKIHSLSTRRA